MYNNNNNNNNNIILYIDGGGENAQDRRDAIDGPTITTPNNNNNILHDSQVGLLYRSMSIYKVYMIYEFGLAIASAPNRRVLRLIILIYTSTEAYSGMGERDECPSVVCVCVFRLIHSYYNNLCGRLYYV